jgi:hypothetical protein
VKDSGRPGKSASALHYGHSAGVDFGFNVRPTVGSHLGMRISNFAPKKPSNGVFLTLCQVSIDIWNGFVSAVVGR